ncbi:hypothetical protein [Hyperthermus butylicus]|uniref:Uncharacterized protein n=1 Tax=Hyperthermus butylicus (strain DSM 5456 / JCM 9403 / PLM1-5) TaxID=415426 RepID=A2BKU5_HYPBU|nr:hypothetical protein [Hyperthermus butylicus]ABM80606.1 hypothetical protein Hbut_0752 [Hyperthermus butylicus DSM 5456]
MEYSPEKGLIAVALIPNPSCEPGQAILEIASRLDGRRLGNCLVIEADMDAISLADIVADHGAERLVILGPLDEPDKPQGILRLGEYSYIQPDAIDPEELVSRLWPNLTGKLSIRDYIEALRFFHKGVFEAYACNTAGGRIDRETCRRLVEDWLRRLCRVHGEQDQRQ